MQRRPRPLAALRQHAELPATAHPVSLPEGLHHQRAHLVLGHVGVAGLCTSGDIAMAIAAGNRLAGNCRQPHTCTPDGAAAGPQACTHTGRAPAGTRAAPPPGPAPAQMAPASATSAKERHVVAFATIIWAAVPGASRNTCLASACHPASSPADLVVAVVRHLAAHDSSGLLRGAQAQQDLRQALLHCRELVAPAPCGFLRRIYAAVWRHCGELCTAAPVHAWPTMSASPSNQPACATPRTPVA